MCEFKTFRTQARQAFPDLLVTVTMFEEASGVGGEITYYQLTAKGLPIGAATPTAKATTADDAIKALIRLVAPARRAARTARENGLRERSRRPAYQG